MNPEIYTILDDMRQRTPRDPVIATSDKNIYLSIQASRLQVLLAEEAEKATNENIKMQRTITKLTKVMLFVSVVLLFISVFQVALQFFQHPPEIKYQIQKKENNKTLQTENNPVPQTHTAPTGKKEIHK
jgi:hypothetical protein